MSTAITDRRQCGAVRRAMRVARVGKRHVCHCRMCQKQPGGLFAALAGCCKADREWMRGEPALFASSTRAKRGVCRDCGTQPGFACNMPNACICVMMGSMDDPELAPAEILYGLELRVGRVRFCEDGPDEVIGDSPAAQKFIAGKVSRHV